MTNSCQRSQKIGSLVGERVKKTTGENKRRNREGWGRKGRGKGRGC